LEHDEKKKEAFILAFKDAAEQLNLVQQYYEFKWDDKTFGIDEHTWLQYVGAYKNLTWKPGTPPPPTSINTLVGRTKLAGTQVIDANHILSLIGSKVTSPNGVQTVDSETLRIIHEQIQELSNMGEYEQAQLLKEFVDTELVPGNLSSDLNFDEAFEIWKASKLQNAVIDFSSEWGLDSELLGKSVNSYSTSQPDVVPYINELISSVDFSKATNKTAGNLLRHNMTLTTKLPEWIAEIKQKYS
ncbi:type I restriction endonuclease subunit R, partial [Aneurinibacillus aneurinilyticus]